MKLWVDANSCPDAVQDILSRSARKFEVPITFVSHRNLSLPQSELCSSVRVGIGKDATGKHLEKHGRTGDLAITQDIPLAGRLVAKGIVVLDLRGELFTADNVPERLSVRHFVQELRYNGVMTGGANGALAHDHQQFAINLERHLRRLKKPRP